MAAYAATVTVESGPRVIRLVNRVGIIWGSVALSNYNSTRAEITGITKYFRTIYKVSLNISSTNKLGTWIAADKAIKAYVPSTGSEVANDADAGTFDFIAVGLI